MLIFAHLWMLALLPAPLLVYRFCSPLPRHRPALRVPFSDRIRQSGGGGALSSRRGRWLWFVRGTVWVALVFSLARPQWLEPPIERTLPTRDLLLLVDLSGSMEATDFTNAEGQQVDRLSAVKEVVGDFLERREGDRVGLAVFGNSPFLLVPFTTDLDLCRQLLEETSVGMAGPKTALGDAIGLGINLFDESTTPEKTIIVLTDGNDTSSAVPPIEASRVASDREIKIYTVAIGDPQTVGEEELDQNTLREVAETTEGSFFLALNRGELEGIYQKLDALETSEVETVSHRPRRDLYFWPLGVALVLSLLAQSKVLLRGGGLRRTPASARVRVNSSTFELEIESSESSSNA